MTIDLNTTCNSIVVPLTLARDAYQLAVAEGYSGSRAEWLSGKATLGDTALIAAENLGDLADVPAARANLGLGSLATSSNISGLISAGGSIAISGSGAAGDPIVISVSGSISPNAHATTHGTAGADPITPAMIGAASQADFDELESQMGDVAAALDAINGE